MNAAAQLAAKIEAMPIDTLRSVMVSLMNDFRPEADTVFAVAMNSAQARMTCAEFIVLCNELEAAA